MYFCKTIYFVFLNYKRFNVDVFVIKRVIKVIDIPGEQKPLVLCTQILKVFQSNVIDYITRLLDLESYRTVYILA